MGLSHNTNEQSMPYIIFLHQEHLVYTFDGTHCISDTLACAMVMAYFIAKLFGGFCLHVLPVAVGFYLMQPNYITR